MLDFVMDVFIGSDSDIDENDECEGGICEIDGENRDDENNQDEDEWDNVK